MEINNSQSLWSTFTSSQSSTTTQTMELSSAFADLLSATATSTSSDYLQEITSLGAESMGTPPNFSEMTTEEFREHLIEMQMALAESGADISNLADPSEMTTEELVALQSEMASHRPPPPPPPADFSMDMMNLNFVDYSNLSETLLTTLFDYL